MQNDKTTNPVINKEIWLPEGTIIDYKQETKHTMCGMMIKPEPSGVGSGLVILLLVIVIFGLILTFS
jgi:hypothetical protein